jgi:hypothetical protein
MRPLGAEFCADTHDEGNSCFSQRTRLTTFFFFFENVWLRDAVLLLLTHAEERDTKFTQRRRISIDGEYCVHPSTVFPKI